MAPELFEGIPASHRSDVYAVGVMYYYLLSERLPFASDQLGQLIQLHREEPVPDIRRIVPEVPDFVATIIGRCLAKYPEQRYETADELADDLQSAIYQLRDTESLVAESLEGLGGFVQRSRESYRILFPVPGDRLQEVYIEVSQGRTGRTAPDGLLGLRTGRARPLRLRPPAELEPDLRQPLHPQRQRRAHVRHGPDLCARPRLLGRHPGRTPGDRGRADWVEQQLSHADLY